MNTAVGFIGLVRVCFDSIMEQNLLPADLPEVQDLQNAILGLEREQQSLRQKLNKTVDMNDRTFADLDAARREVIFLKRLVAARDETIESLNGKLSETKVLKAKIKALKNEKALVEAETFKSAIKTKDETIKELRAELDTARHEVASLKEQLLDAQRINYRLDNELLDADKVIDAKEEELMEANNLIRDLMIAADMPTDLIVWG